MTEANLRRSRFMITNCAKGAERIDATVSANTSRLILGAVCGLITTAAYVASAGLAQAVTLDVSSGSSWRSFGSSVGTSAGAIAPPPVDASGNAWTDPGYSETNRSGTEFWDNARAPYPNGVSDPDDIRPGSSNDVPPPQLMWHDPLAISNGATGSQQAWFRKQFDLDLVSDPTPLAAAYVIADDVFHLFVNGTQVAGPTALDNNKRPNGQPRPVAVTFTDLLQDGPNVIAVQAHDGTLSSIQDRGSEYAFLSKATNFKNTVSGSLFLAAESVGRFEASIYYNLRDNQINVFDASGIDELPDKMKVSCLSAIQNNGTLCGSGGNINAYEIWGLDPTLPAAANPEGLFPNFFGEAEYTPFSEFADEYVVALTLELESGPVIGTFTELQEIESIFVRNNIELNFTVFNDTVVIQTEDWSFRFNNSTSPDDDVPPLDDILLENALLRLPGFSLDSTGSFAGIGFMGRGYIGVFDSIGPLTAVLPEDVPGIPEPVSLAPLAVGLVGLGLSMRRRKASTTRS